MFNYLFDNFVKLIFVQNNYISFVILTSLIIWVIYLLFKREKVSSDILIVLLLIIPLIFIILNQTPSGAYLPILLPTTILLIASFVDFFIKKRIMFIPALIFLVFLVVGNISYMLKNNFVYDESGKFFTLDKRLQAADQILNLAQEKDYNLKGIGPGSEFESFTMNYEYLTWWLGHGPSKENVKTKIYVSESATGIKIENINK